MIKILLLLLIHGNSFAQNEKFISTKDTTLLQTDSSVTTNYIIISDTVITLIDTTFNFTDSTFIQSDSNKYETSIKQRDSILSSSDSLSVKYFEGSVENLKLNHPYNIDTNTYCFQKFDPLQINNGLYSTLSNIGMAAKNMVYSPTLSTGYYLGSSSFTNYLYHNSKVKYYKLFMPYTDLSYVMGSNREQNFNVVFTRKFFRGFTFGIDYALNFSPSRNSPYLRTGINEQRAFFTSQYYTKNKRYGIIANYLINKIVVEENGGIKYDSIFKDNLETDRRLIPVNLMNADNLIKQSGFFIEQYFNLLPPKLKNDSIKRRIDPGNISYSFRYKRNKMVYHDGSALSAFYINPLLPIDSISTFDSLFQSNFQNTLRWSNIGYHENPLDKIFYMYLGATHSYIEQLLPYDSVRSKYSQLTTFGGVAFNFGRSFHLGADVNYVFGNYNQDDYELNVLLKQYLGTELKNVGFLKFGLNFINKTPEWYYNNYQSNYYRWSNNLKKEKYFILSGSYNYKQFSAGAKFYTIENHTYLNDSIRPKQIENAETLLQLFVEGTIPLSKFGINTRIVYQSTSQPNIIRFPSLLGVMDIYFRSAIFKHAAILQTGFQVTYFSEYYADAYMPELRLFYTQNNIKIGNYPYLDFYFTLMVKRARMFFKIAHFNSYLGDYRYYLAPNYPARDARFYLGVSWRFHD
ncbi:MAG: hypothetical protein H8E34_10860 [Bacteroidetes bacterium]|nr:hypothetical protein [Bacteroidota bacterium]